MKALHRLWKCGHALRRGATNKVEERLDSLIPAPSSDHAFTVEAPRGTVCSEGHNDVSGGDEPPGCVATPDLSINTCSRQKTRPLQNSRGLDGAWEATGGRVNQKMSAFIIAGSNFTSAENRSYHVAFGQEPNTILFGDSILELVADGVAWLHITSQQSVCYKRVDLPAASVLSTMEGSWKYGGGNGSSPTALFIQGAFWYFSAGEKSSCGLVHKCGHSKAAMLLNHRIRTTASGKLLLQPARGSALKFRRAAPPAPRTPRTQLWTLRE